MNPHNHPHRAPNHQTSYHARRELVAAQRRVECVNLRIQGKTVRQIAKDLGMSSSSVQAHLQAALAETRAAAHLAAIQLRTKERHRLEELLAHWTPIALGDTNTWQAAKAAHFVLEAQEELCGLYGWSEPMKELPHTATGATDAQAPTSSAPPLDPAQDALLNEVSMDVLVAGAQMGLLPRSGYDEAWDAFETLRNAGGAWQPAAYHPFPEMEAYLREHWSELMPEGAAGSRA